MSKRIKQIINKWITPIVRFFSCMIQDFGKAINTIYVDFKKLLSFLYSPITFVSGLGAYIHLYIKEYSKNSPLKTLGIKIKKFFNIIFKDFFKIIKFLYSPILIVTSIGEIFVDLIKKLFLNHQNINKEIRTFLEEKRYEWFPSRDRRRFEKLKRKLFFNKNETFLNSNLYRIVFITTVGLQCISFFTTFRGTLTFFENVHWSSPLIFTSVLQLLLLILANVAFSKRRRFGGRIGMVCILCCISIFLSYIGIANSAISPVDFYENQYELFEESYTAVYELIEIKTTTGNFESQVETIFKSINDAKSAANNEIKVLTKTNNKLSTVPAYFVNTNEDGKEIRQSNPDYADTLQRIQDNNSKIQQLESFIDENAMKNIDKIKNNILNINIDSLNTTVNYSEALNELYTNNSSIFKDYDELISIYNTLISSEALSNTGLEKISIDLLDIIGIDAIALNIDSLKLNDFSELASNAENKINIIDNDKPEKAKDIYDFLLQGTERPQYINYLYDIIREETDNKYSNMQAAVDQFNTNSKIDEAFSNLTNTYKNLDIRDPYTFAVSHLWDIKSGYYFKVILMVFFAVIVDGLTLLIPLLCEKRRESVLFTKSSEDVLYDQEDVLENLLLSCTLPKPESANETKELSYNEDTYYSMLNTLSSYIKMYEPSPYTISLGFPKRLKSNLLNINFTGQEKKDQIDNIGLYKELTSFLMTMGYVKFISREEYYLLKCDYYNIIPNETPKDSNNITGKEEWKTEDGYFLLKGNFILWMNDNRLAWLGKKHKKTKGGNEDGNI